MRAYFVTQLRHNFEAQPSLPTDFSTAFAAFLLQVEQFIDLLLVLRDLSDTSEWKDERADATFQLMDFCQRAGRHELYIRFVNQLVRIHIEAKDLVAAGHATYLHALMYEWDGERVVPEWVGQGVALPRQTAFARRESLYYQAIDHFGE